MVALNEKLHYHGTAVRSNRCRAGKSGESEKSVDIPISDPLVTSVAIQHPPRSSAASSCKSVNPPGPIYCGYPDKNPFSRDIGTGLNDPECELYYVRNRTYSPVLGRWIQRDPIGYAGGINVYEYVGGRPVTAVDPRGTDVQTACQSRCWQTCGNNDSPACQSCITCCEYAGEDPAAAAKCFPPPPQPPGPHPFGCGCSKSLCEQRCGEIGADGILACLAGCAIGCFWARGGYGKCFLTCDGICSAAVGNAQAACTAGCAACPNP